MGKDGEQEERGWGAESPGGDFPAQICPRDVIGSSLLISLGEGVRLEHCALKLSLPAEQLEPVFASKEVPAAFRRPSVRHPERASPLR